MLSRIVAGVDGSDASIAAARLAAAEAAAASRALRLVHARLPVADYAMLLPPGIAADVEAAPHVLIEAVRGDLRRDHPGLDVRISVTESGPTTALLRASRSAGLLVVGRSGLHPGRRSPAGSTAERVAATAGCPVMVVGPRLPEWGEVVIGFDPEDPASPAVSYAFASAQWRGSSLRVCCVRPVEGDRWTDDATARRAVNEAISGWRTTFADVPVSVDVLAGLDPVARLLDASAGAGLIVVGEGNRLHLDPDPAGPLSDVLVRNAACPVAVVRPPRRHSRRIDPGPMPSASGPNGPRPDTRSPRRSEHQSLPSM